MTRHEDEETVKYSEGQCQCDCDKLNKWCKKMKDGKEQSDWFLTAVSSSHLQNKNHKLQGVLFNFYSTKKIEPSISRKKE